MSKKKNALIIVDVQNDFLPANPFFPEGGTLAVPTGNEIIHKINKLSTSLGREYEVVVATQDYHPKNHKSFASNHSGKNIYDQIELNGSAQTLWPDHCVEGTLGSDFSKELNEIPIMAVFQKGTNPEVDSYSGFLDNDKKTETGLNAYLLENKITHVDIVGLATDYCVKATALDAIKLGYKTRVLAYACKAVNLNPTDEKAALEEIKAKGGEVILEPIPQTKKEAVYEL